MASPGTQTTGQGHKSVAFLSLSPSSPSDAACNDDRLFWSTTSELRAKLSDMSERIRMLEEALKASHRLTHTEAHPLLTDELLKIKEVHEHSESSTRGTTPQSATGTDGDNGTGEIENAFGSLSVSQSGVTKYFGHAANSWVRIRSLYGLRSQRC